MDERNGLDHDSAISCDDVVTVPKDDVLRPVGFLSDEQEEQLRAAVLRAFDL